MKISVIIPVYNVELYLCQCIDSILNQTYKDIEIILVDDGSTDNSPNLCDEYVKRDNRIVAYHKKNGGLSDARNYGLVRANGDYIVFLDSDDFWMSQDDLAALVKILERENLDFLGFNTKHYYTNSKSFEEWPKYNIDIKETSKEVILTKLTNNGNFPVSACMKVIKRKFLLDNNLYFIKGIYCEDIPWFLKMLEKAENFKFVDLYVYAYRKGVVTSITGKFNSKRYNDLFTIMVNAIKDINKSSSSEKIKEALMSFVAYEYLILLSGIYSLKGKDREKSKNDLFHYKWLLKYTLNRKVFLANIVYRLVGIDLTAWLMHRYMQRKLNSFNS